MSQTVGTELGSKDSVNENWCRCSCIVWMHLRIIAWCDHIISICQSMSLLAELSVCPSTSVPAELSVSSHPYLQNYLSVNPHPHLQNYVCQSTAMLSELDIYSFQNTEFPVSTYMTLSHETSHKSQASVSSRDRNSCWWSIWGIFSLLQIYVLLALNYQAVVIFSFRNGIKLLKTGCKCSNPGISRSLATVNHHC